jgi:hypothetical protein
MLKNRLQDVGASPSRIVIDSFKGKRINDHRVDGGDKMTDRIGVDFHDPIMLGSCLRIKEFLNFMSNAASLVACLSIFPNSSLLAFARGSSSAAPLRTIGLAY